MARAIDGDLLVDYIRKIDMPFETKTTVICTVNTMPTIDPVKHGKWIYKPTSDHDGYVVCSNCDVYIPSHKLFGKDDEYTNTSNYCPHCGARMDGE